MREVLISIQPRWVEKIVSGKKTVEVRKTRPKCETPFKVYIYETLGKTKWCNTCKDPCERPYPNCACHEGWGKVIGEFVCDCITPLYNVCYDEWERLLGGLHRIEKQLVENACLTEKELHSYASGKRCYAWHITDLVVYDEPRELRDFKPYNITEEDCKFSHLGLAIPKCKDCRECYVKRPYQSWGYVEATEPRQTAD